MPQFYASTSRGLSEVLAEELRALGLKTLEVDRTGCLFDSSWQGCCRANLQLRSATRVSLPVQDFTAYDDQELYNNVLKHDFTKYLTADQTFVVRSKVFESAITDQRIVALKVKDAIADQFTEKFGKRPDVNKDEPDVRIYIHGHKNQFRVSVDTSGHNLSSRGYRKDAGEAPLREHVASGILNLMKWDQKTPIVDPMCGSGTFLIEAALQATKTAPGSLAKGFSFQNFSHVPSEMFDEEIEAAMESETLPEGLHFYGFDKDSKAIKAAKENAKRAGVEELITFAKGDIRELRKPVESGVILTNPPWGIRLGNEFFLEELYKDFAHVLKTEFQGWSAWLLSGDPQWTRFLKLKASQKYPLDNGGVDCRLIHYSIR